MAAGVNVSVVRYNYRINGFEDFKHVLVGKYFKERNFIGFDFH